MIALIRHSARLDSFEPEKWKKSKRYKKNIFDTPICKKLGEKIAKRAIYKLFESGFNKIEYLYSSPLTRCIQTALIIQKEIKKEFKKEIKIRVEYGLSELEKKPIIINNKKAQYDTEKVYIDEQLLLENIIKNHGDNFDMEYESIIDPSKLQLETEELPFYNRSIQVYQKIKENIKDNNTIICTHGGFMYVIYSYLINKIDLSNITLYKGLNEYCSIILDNPKRKKPKLLS